MDRDEVDRLVIQFATQLALHHHQERGDSSVGGMIDWIKPAVEDPDHFIGGALKDVVRLNYLEPAKHFVEACVALLEESRDE